MDVAVVGSRTFKDYKLLLNTMQKLAIGEIDNIVSGGAAGADSLGKRFANRWQIATITFPANWDKYGKSAGFRRNQHIVDYSDMVVAFWDGKSKGTKDTIDKARIAKKSTYIVYF